ncbi:MAG: hypothetical protein AB1767_06180 [Bacillota bacterium]
MRRRALIGCLMILLLLAVVSGCETLTKEDPNVQSDDGANGGEKPDPDPGAGGDNGINEDPGWEFMFTAQEMFSGNKVDFPADFIGKVVYLSFYFYG